MNKLLAITLLLAATAGLCLATTSVPIQIRASNGTSVMVQYGPTTSYGTNVTINNAGGNSYSVQIALPSNSTQHVRICLLGANLNCGGDMVVNVGPGTAVPTFTGTMDKYGGAQTSGGAVCTADGQWHKEKVTISGGLRWALCDPFGNFWFMKGVWNVSSSNLNAGVANAMYGDATCYWSLEGATQRLKYWNFNFISAYSSTFTWPTANSSACVAKWNDAFGGHTQPVKMPATVDLIRANLYSYANATIAGGATNANFDSGYNTTSAHKFVKEVWSSVRTTTYNLFKFKSPDQEDPLYKSWLIGAMSAYSGAFSGTYGDYLVGFFVDETDQLGGFGAGATGEFSTSANGAAGGGRNHPHLGLMTLAAAPFQASGSPENGTFQTTGSSKNTLCATSNGFKALYADPIVYGKKKLRDYLQTTLGYSISTLNTRWGSNYGQFDSAATVVTGESVGTGDGATTTFAIALANAPDPGTVQVFVNGALTLGDDANSTNIGNLYKETGSPTSCSAVDPGQGQVNYTSSSQTNTGGREDPLPAKKLNITLSPAPANGATISVNYHSGGWTKGVAGTLGLLDEDGSSTWFCKADFQNLSGCTANMIADLDGFLQQYSADYFGQIMAARDQTIPQALLFGPTYLGTWGAPSRAKVLQGAAGKLDVMNVYDMPPHYTSGNDDQARMDHIRSNAGDIPLKVWTGIVATADCAVNSPNDAVVGFGGTKPNSQAQRATLFTNRVSDFETYSYSSDGTRPIVGYDLWDLVHDTANMCWGLVDRAGQAQDGVENVSAAGVACGNGATLHLSQNACGSDTGNYGNFTDTVKTVNGNIYSDILPH